MNPSAPAWRLQLRRELVGLLALKLLALGALWFLFFSPPHRPAQNSQAVAARLLPAAAAPRSLADE